MKPVLPLLQLGLLAVLTLGVSLRGQPADAPASPDAPAAAEAPAATDTSEWRHLDQETSPEAEPEDNSAVDDTSEPAPEDGEASADDAGDRQHRHPHRERASERVTFGANSTLKEGETASVVVSILGSSTSAGEVQEGVVSILGNSRVTGGSVGNEVVSILGNTYINGHVHGEVVTILGNVELGPDAVVDGEIVCIGGRVTAHPNAIQHGESHHIAVGGGFGEFGAFNAWVTHCFMKARPLAFADGLGAVWAIAFVVLGFYALVALLAPRAVTNCVHTLETRPGYSLLAMLLSMLLVPVAIVLLCITVVGIALVPFIALALFLLGLFGKVVMLAWIGSRLTKFSGSGVLTHPALTVLIGGAIVLLLYTVPVLGFIVYKLLGGLGLGVVIYAIILNARRENVAAPKIPAAPSSGAGMAPSVPPVVAVPSESVAPAPDITGVAASAPTQSATFGQPSAPAAAADVPPVAPRPAPAAFVPPVVPVAAATLPRAGFWIRLGASALDALVVGLVLGVLPHALQPNFLLLYAAYCVTMWALKGSTVGGIVCGLKVVRIDDRRVDWMTAVVRGLGGFLSLIPLGFGFVWVSFDPSRQSWHDKIAGTTIVQVPKGVSLI